MTRFVLFPEKMNAEQKTIISKNIAFYNNLSGKTKGVFEHRVLKFIAHHNFVGRRGMLITEEMKLLIGSTAIMLTFGMRRYLFSQFENIIIYPKNYLSKVTKQRHKGETNPKFGAIVFSWDDFLQGIKVENDNMNLGLHELTHALHFSFLTYKSFTAIVFLDYFRSLLEQMKDRDLQRKIVASGYLRQYGFKNKYEFLSVIVEHYFESPQEFKEKLPEIYRMVRLMLNLDTLKLGTKVYRFKKAS